MTPFELTAILFALGAAAARFAVPHAERWLLAGAVVALGLALFDNPARWQLAPALLAVALLALIAARPGRFGLKSSLAATALLVIAAALAQGFALVELPAPGGRYAVGTVHHTLVRPAPGGDRRLFVKLWYPTNAPGGRTEGLWSELPRMADIPELARWGLAYLNRVPTHSWPRARYADDAPLRVVLYNHAFVSWASENSLLAEELASRGFTVVAVRHMGQLGEYEALVPDNGKPKSAIAGAARIVARRVADSRFVADRLGAVLGAVPNAPESVPPGYAAMGFSLGGAISTDLCASDRQCRAVVNIDGSIPGVDYPRLPVPAYLMILGAGHEDVPRSVGHYRNVTFPRAAHLDFHDAAIAVPPARWVFGGSTDDIMHQHRRIGGMIADFLARADR